MSVTPSPVGRFEASRTELNRLLDAHATERLRGGLQSLTEMLIERIRPAPGRSATLGPNDVAALEEAARGRGSDVESAFKRLLAEALDGTIDLGSGKQPLLLLEEAAREQLATFAGVSSVTDQTVRGGLEAKADGVQGATNPRAFQTFVQTNQWYREGLGGLARGGKAGQKTTPIGLVGAGLRDVARDAGQPSVAAETLEALGPRITDAVTTIGAALWKDDRVKASVAKLVTDPKNAKALLPALCKDSGHVLSSVLGCKLVNQELLTSAGKMLATKTAEVGAKQGAKKGVMGLLSTIPLANTIPMLFTGGEILAELTKKPPDKRVLGKGLATFALQVGALAFPPLGLAAAATDLTGSVAIAVADGQQAGLSKDERKAKAEEAIGKQDERELDMADAIKSNAGLTSQALSAIERSLRQLGSDGSADRAATLAQRADETASKPDDVQSARTLQNDIGRFSFDVLLPEMVDRVKQLEAKDSEDAGNWSLLAEALGQIGVSATGIRKDADANEPRLKMLLSAMLRAAIAGGSVAREDAAA